MSYIEIPIRTENDLNASADINQLMENIRVLKDEAKSVITDMFYPAGKGKYIQLSEPDGTFDEDEEPEVKFGGTWVLIFDDEGTFFKTEGHEPAQIYDSGELEDYRINGLRKDKSQLIYGSAMSRSIRGDVASLADGVFYWTVETGTSSVGTSTSGTALRFHFLSRLSPNARTTVDYEGRTEPQNRLMRIWKRVA